MRTFSELTKKQKLQIVDYSDTYYSPTIRVRLTERQRARETDKQRERLKDGQAERWKDLDKERYRKRKRERERQLAGEQYSFSLTKFAQR